jgi:hypothetical protein
VIRDLLLKIQSSVHRQRIVDGFTKMSKMPQLAHPSRLPAHPDLVENTFSISSSLRSMQLGI